MFLLYVSVFDRYTVAVSAVTRNAYITAKLQKNIQTGRKHRSKRAFYKYNSHIFKFILSYLRKLLLFCTLISTSHALGLCVLMIILT